MINKYIILLLLISMLHCSEGASHDRDGRIIAAMSTFTKLTFSSSTTTISYTCATLVNTAACGRRRRRSTRIRSLKLTSDNAPTELSDSLADSPSVHPASSHNDSKRKGRIALTLWSSVTSTVTVLSTSINTLTTYSVSFWCSAVGGTFPPVCA